jgi:uncharacterized spore protein YtfJ
MQPSEILEKIGQSLGATASVKSVFGEPIRHEGRTVVPVATVRYGFGAGGGHAKHDREGGGGGGGVMACPAGALEITDTGTRFVPFTDWRWLALAFAVGAFAGSLAARRPSKDR